MKFKLKNIRVIDFHNYRRLKVLTNWGLSLDESNIMDEQHILIEEMKKDKTWPREDIYKSDIDLITEDDSYSDSESNTEFNAEIESEVRKSNFEEMYRSQINILAELGYEQNLTLPYLITHGGNVDTVMNAILDLV